MRPALFLFLFAPLAVGCSQTPSAEGPGQSATNRERAAAPEDAAVVRRIQLHHMSAGDFDAVLEHRFRRGLWVRVENRYNAVLVAGDADLVAEAEQLAAVLDVPPPGAQ